jgi:hypothetical protein
MKSMSLLILYFWWLFIIKSSSTEEYINYSMTLYYILDPGSFATAKCARPFCIKENCVKKYKFWGSRKSILKVVRGSLNRNCNGHQQRLEAKKFMGKVLK